MSDTYSIIYSSEAKDDLREIYSYIAYDLQAPRQQRARSIVFGKKSGRWILCRPDMLSWIGSRGKAWGCIGYR